MTAVREHASVHPATVTRFSQGVPLLPTRARPNERVSAVVVRVDSRVWATALRLADGDWRRLSVIDATTVVVLNQRRRGQA